MFSLHVYANKCLKGSKQPFLKPVSDKIFSNKDESSIGAE